VLKIVKEHVTVGGVLFLTLGDVKSKGVRSDSPDPFTMTILRQNVKQIKEKSHNSKINNIVFLQHLRHFKAIDGF
jgi:hypothetical protein